MGQRLTGGGCGAKLGGRRGWQSKMEKGFRHDLVRWGALGLFRELSG